MSWVQIPPAPFQFEKVYKKPEPLILRKKRKKAFFKKKPWKEKKMRSILRRKKAAFEMSMTTVVVIVLAMTMLALGLVLVRTIFKGATYTAESLNEKVKSEMDKTFADDSDLSLLISGPPSRRLGICQGAQPYLHYYLATKTGGKIELTLTKESIANTALCQGLEKDIKMELSASPQEIYEPNKIEKSNTILLTLPQSIPAGCEFRIKLTAKWSDGSSKSDSIIASFKKATLGICQND